MIPRREELVEVSPPASPRTSSASSVSAYLQEHDFLSSPIRSPASETSTWSDSKPAVSGRLRHAVGIALLLATVFLWTASNFLASVRCTSACPTWACLCL
jgi:solute carrier family 35 protein F5